MIFHKPILGGLSTRNNTVAMACPLLPQRACAVILSHPGAKPTPETLQEMTQSSQLPALLTFLRQCGSMCPSRLTFPEDWMPLTTAMPTMVQATRRHRVIFQLRPPLSEMELEMSKASRYQK